MKPDPLEGNFLFRLVKVAYIVCLVLGLLVVASASWGSRPVEWVDWTKTTINCPNGKSYTAGDIDLLLLKQETFLDSYDDERARIACIYGEKKDYTKQYTLPITVDYTMSYSTFESGDWLSVGLWLSIGTLVVYVVLNLLRETLNYIFFGRRFQWDWLRKLYAFFNTES